MSVLEDPASALAGRLYGLRVRHWPDVRLNQSQLAEALGVSTALVSSWEKSNAVPPAHRLAAYAAFFATRRSVTSTPYRLLPADGRTSEEEEERDNLEQELLNLRDAALSTDQEHAKLVGSPLGGSWWFSDGSPITIACSELPAEQRIGGRDPAHATLAYGQLYSYADIDALLELHGHLRAANPTSRVFVRKASDLRQGDYQNHLVALGGVDWNPLTRSAFARLSLPIRQVSESDDPAKAYFEVSDGEVTRFDAELSDDGELLSDIGLLVRAPNPFHPERTITVCCAMYSLGVRGVVTALTDERLRERNEACISKEFSAGDTFAILFRIPVVADKAVTPDWTHADTILHRWAPTD